MKNNKLINLYNSFFKFREEERDEALIRGFIGKFPKNTPYDLEIIDQYFNDPQFVEKEIIRY